MKTLDKMMNVTSTSLPPGLRPLVGLALVGLLSLACDGDGPTHPGDQNFSRLTIISGDAQQGRVSEQLTDPFVLRMTDIEGRPIAGAKVFWQVLAGGGDIPGPPASWRGEATEATTGEDGIASVFLVLGPQPGLNLVEAQALFAEENPRFSATGVR